MIITTPRSHSVVLTNFHCFREGRSRWKAECCLFHFPGMPWLFTSFPQNLDKLYTCPQNTEGLWNAFQTVKKKKNKFSWDRKQQWGFCHLGGDIFISKCVSWSVSPWLSYTWSTDGWDLPRDSMIMSVIFSEVLQRRECDMNVYLFKPAL